MAKLLTYRHVWTGRDRDGNATYEYYCTWSDGYEGLEISLPWGKLEGAANLDCGGDVAIDTGCTACVMCQEQAVLIERCQS